MGVHVTHVVRFLSTDDNTEKGDGISHWFSFDGEEYALRRVGSESDMNDEYTIDGIQLLDSDGLAISVAEHGRIFKDLCSVVRDGCGNLQGTRGFVFFYQSSF